MTRHEMYMRAVREEEAKLETEVAIITLPDPLLPPSEWKAGVVCMAPRRLAAERIVQRSHRLATDAELAQMKAEQKKREDQCAAIESAQQRKSSLSVSLALSEAVKLLGVPEK